MLYKRGRKTVPRVFLLEGQVDLIGNDYSVRTVVAGSPQSLIPLNPSTPSTNSAVAKSDKVKVFSVEPAVMESIIRRSQSFAAAEIDTASSNGKPIAELEVKSVDDWMSILLQSPLFQSIPLTKMPELFGRFENVKCRRGEVIIREGAPGDYFYVIAAGKALVINRTGRLNVELHPGQCFGEEALLGNTLRNATVTMLRGGSLKRLNLEDFNALLRDPVIQYVDSAALKALNKPVKLLDVKMPVEYRAFHVPGSINVPLSRLRSTMTELGNKSMYVVTDDAGSRAEVAVHLLRQAGFDAVILRGRNQLEASA